MSKYNIDKDYRLFCLITMPINRFILSIGNFFLRFISFTMKSNKKLNIKQYKIKSFDDKKCKLYIIKPKMINKKCKTAVMFHGGGFVFKGAPHHYYLAKKYAEENNMIVVFVDYRLAYNNKYLTTLNDCFYSYKWILDNADDLLIDKNNIMFIGDSAGGFLSIKTMLLAENNSLILPKGAILSYPVIDKNMISKSMKLYLSTPIWNARLNKKMWDYYLKGNDELSLLEEDLSFLNNIYIEVCEFDCLKDEGILFYEKLSDYKINVEINKISSTMHGFDVNQKAKITKNAIDKRNEFIKHIFNK